MGAQAMAGDDAVIYLKDGSVIRGKITSHVSRVYSVKTPSLGTMRIHESKIASIKMGAAALPKGNSTPSAGAGASNALGRETQAMQKKLMADPEIMNVILSLADDPQIQQVLADPAILQAVSAGNMDALVANPKFLKLMSHPKVLEITQKATR